MSKRSTLIVEGIVNLTKKEMWMYGTSGSLIKLNPIDPDEIFGESHQFKDKTYYIAEGEVEQRLLEDPRFKGMLAKGSFTGLGKNGAELYHFYNADGVEVIPITDRTGESGYRRNFHPGDGLIKLPPIHFNQFK